MPLTLQQFLDAVAADEAKPGYQQRLAAEQGDSDNINDPAHPGRDAYYEDFGKELDEHPIGVAVVSRGHSKG